MTDSKSIPEISTKADLETYAGKTATVLGTYRQTSVSKAGGSAAAAEHVTIVLDDGTRVWLLPPGTAQAKRSEKERNQHEGKAVAVTGIVMTQTPDEDGRASLQGPCFVTLGGVAPRGLHDMMKGL